MQYDLRPLVHVGDYTDACHVCYETKERFGVLIDPVGHKWRICQDCLNALWQDRQAMNQLDEKEKQEAEALDRVFAKLRDQIIKGE